MEENQTVPSLPPSSGQTAGTNDKRDQQSKAPIVLIIVAVVIVLLLIAAAVLLLRSDNQTTGRVRDVFIIFMALESLVIGVALIVLIVQLATLINLLQNEIRPIISTTNETVNTLKGTVTFISDNLTEPVIKLNAYLAGIRQFIELLRPARPRR
jgi:amino acid transporter